MNNEGVKYACDQCDYQATQQGNLTRHIQNMHEVEGVKDNTIQWFVTKVHNYW